MKWRKGFQTEVKVSRSEQSLSVQGTLKKKKLWQKKKTLPGRISSNLRQSSLIPSWHLSEGDFLVVSKPQEDKKRK